MTKKSIHVVFLAAASSIHVVRWVNALVKKGLTVSLITLHKPDPLNPIDKRIKIYVLPFSPPLGYVFNTSRIKNILFTIKPDIAHAIYAIGYGTLLRLSNFRPSILSVIGSDISELPSYSWKNKIISSNLRFPNQITTNSVFLRKRVANKIVNQKIKVIPFGVNTSIFKPVFKKNNRQLIVGTIKTLEFGYGIDILVKAFGLISNKYPDVSLVIAGQGSQKKYLIELSKKLKVSTKIKFIGSIAHPSVAKILNSFSIFVCLSRNEGFGVSVIEAAACGLPVVVSNVGGLPETLINGKTGFIVNKNDPLSAAKAIEKLINNPKLRFEMGKSGRKFVMENYDWKDCVDHMLSLYSKLLALK